MRIYLDSNVFISLVNEEMGKHFRLMYHHTEEFLMKIKDKHTIVLSELFFRETSKATHSTTEEIIEQIQKFSTAIEIIFITEEDTRFAKHLLKKGIHFLDALHAALAIRSLADVIITWNMKDFSVILDLIKSITPEDFLQ